MKIRDLATTGIKLLGIFSVFQFLSLLPTAFSVYQMRKYYQNATGDYIDLKFRVNGMLRLIQLARPMLKQTDETQN